MSDSAVLLGQSSRLFIRRHLPPPHPSPYGHLVRSHLFMFITAPPPPRTMIDVFGGSSEEGLARFFSNRGSREGAGGGAEAVPSTRRSRVGDQTPAETITVAGSDPKRSRCKLGALRDLRFVRGGAVWTSACTFNQIRSRLLLLSAPSGSRSGQSQKQRFRSDFT